MQFSKVSERWQNEWCWRDLRAGPALLSSRLPSRAIGAQGERKRVPTVPECGAQPFAAICRQAYDPEFSPERGVQLPRLSRVR